MRLFRRKPTKPDPIQQPVRLELVHPVTHRVTVEYLPKPRPNMMYVEIANRNGEIWRVAPVSISGQYIQPVYVPLSFLIGDRELVRVLADQLDDAAKLGAL